MNLYTPARLRVSVTLYKMTNTLTPYSDSTVAFVLIYVIVFVIVISVWICVWICIFFDVFRNINEGGQLLQCGRHWYLGTGTNQIEKKSDNHSQLVFIYPDRI